jgi:hypothetical protein
VIGCTLTSRGFKKSVTNSGIGNLLSIPYLE